MNIGRHLSVRRQEANDGATRQTLARSRLTNQTHGLAFMHLEVHPTYDLGDASARGERNAQILDLQQTHRDPKVRSPRVMAVANETDADAEEHKHDARDRGDPPRGEQVTLTARDYRTEVGAGRLLAEAEVRQSPQ